MAATSIFRNQGEKYQLCWNDGTPLNIAANIIANSITLTNLIKDSQKEKIIHCYSKNIEGHNVKLYFQHYHSLLTNQTLPNSVNIIKLMELLLVANYFDDPLMISVITRRIITSIHNMLWRAKLSKDKNGKPKVKKLRRKFSLLPPEVQNIILADLEKYAAIKGPYQIVRHVSAPSNINYRIRKMLITNQGKIIAALEILRTLPSISDDNQHLSGIRLYDELNPHQAEALNKLKLNLTPCSEESFTSWSYNDMGGLSKDGVIWAITRAKPVEGSDTEARELIGPPAYNMSYYFYFPDGSRVKSNGRTIELIKYRPIAIINPDADKSWRYFSTNRQIVDIPSGNLINTIDNAQFNMFYDPTGRYMVKHRYYINRGLMIKLFEMDKSQPLFQSLIGELTKEMPGPPLIKIDPYRQLVYIIAPVIWILVILDFNGKIVAHYSVPAGFSIYFGPDMLVTIEHTQLASSLSSRQETTNHPVEINDSPQLPVTMPPLKTMPQIKNNFSAYIVVERDINNDWRPLVILSKIPTSVNSRAPEIIFSPNGHYLLMASSVNRISRDFFALPVVAYTRLHPLEEIAMIREALLDSAEAKTDISPCQASTSSAP